MNQVLTIGHAPQAAAQAIEDPDFQWLAVSRSSGEFLKRLLVSRQRRNPRLSLRWLASFCGVSASNLSNIMNGRRQLTPELLIKISRKMELPSAQEIIWMALLRWETLGRSTEIPISDILAQARLVPAADAGTQTAVPQGEPAPVNFDDSELLVQFTAERAKDARSIAELFAFLAAQVDWRDGSEGTYRLKLERVRAT